MKIGYARSLVVRRTKESDDAAGYASANNLFELLEHIDRGGKVSVNSIQKRSNVSQGTAKKYLSILKKWRQLGATMQGSEKFWSLAVGGTATRGFDEVAGLELAFRSAPWLHASPYRDLLFARVATEREGVPQDQQDRLQTFIRSFCHRAQGDATYATKVQELACLLRAIRERRPCSFKYERDDGKSREYRVEPLLMVLYKDRLYLLARKEPDAVRRTFVLDSITSARVDDDGPQFAIADARYTDPADVFRSSFGIFTDVSAPVDVEIEVRGSAATLLRRRKMHATQEASPRANGWWSVRWHVASCPELRSFIASLFPNVRVVKPTQLVDDVSQLARDHLAIATQVAGS